MLAMDINSNNILFEQSHLLDHKRMLLLTIDHHCQDGKFRHH